MNPEKTVFVLIDTWNKPIGKTFDSLNELIQEYNLGMLEQKNYKIRKIITSDFPIDEIKSIEQQKEFLEDDEN
ncbi:MAG: hypothetical protein AABW47_04495 [Nanoarchaeota archaeon]